MIGHVVFYALRDPRDNRVRWVGQTAYEKARLRAHMSPRRADTSARALWIRSLKADGLRPIMDRLERRPLIGSGNPGERERHWMSVMLANGEPLLNVALPGRKRSEPTKAARAFDAFLCGDNPTKAKITIDAAGTALGVTDPTIIAWRRGDAKPNPILRGAIERWTSGRVKAEDWADAEERAAIRRADAVEPLALADTVPPGAA